MKTVTFDELMNVVRRMSNQCYVRYFLHLKPGYFVLSLVDLDSMGVSHPTRVYEADLLNRGFMRLETPAVLGTVYEAKRGRGVPSE